MESLNPNNTVLYVFYNVCKPEKCSMENVIVVLVFSWSKKLYETKKSSDFSELYAVWTGLELFAKTSDFSGLPKGSFLGGTELLTF